MLCVNLIHIIMNIINSTHRKTTSIGLLNILQRAFPRGSVNVVCISLKVVWLMRMRSNEDRGKNSIKSWIQLMKLNFSPRVRNCNSHCCCEAVWYSSPPCLHLNCPFMAFWSPLFAACFSLRTRPYHSKEGIYNKLARPKSSWSYAVSIILYIDVSGFDVICVGRFWVDSALWFGRLVFLMGTYVWSVLWKICLPTALI